MIEIKRYTPAQRQEWDTMVDRCCNATFLHCRGYMDYHSDRFDDCSLMAYESGKLVALLPANLSGGVLYSHQGLTYGGWLHAVKGFNATVMMAVADAAWAWAKAQGVSQIVYKAVPHIYHRYPAEEDVYALFRHGAALSECNLSTVVPLHDPQPFDRGNKSGVNMARKAGVEVGQSTDWDGYWALLSDVLADRHHAAPVHTVEEIKLLQSRFPQNIQLHTATLHGQMVAGVVLFCTHTVAHCQYIASSHEGREKKALSLLFRHLIDEAAQQGLRYFDFGTSNEDHGRLLNDGLLQQKARLGGRGVAYAIYQINLNK